MNLPLEHARSRSWKLPSPTNPPFRHRGDVRSILLSGNPDPWKSARIDGLRRSRRIQGRRLRFSPTAITALASSLDALADRLAQEHLLRELSMEDFAGRAAHYFAELNAVHPFQASGTLAWQYHPPSHRIGAECLLAIRTRPVTPPPPPPPSPQTHSSRRCRPRDESETPRACRVSGR